MSSQNCTECGTPGEPGQSFCDACGAVLSWTGHWPLPGGRGPGGSGGSGGTAGTTGSAGTTGAGGPLGQRDPGAGAEAGPGHGQAPGHPSGQAPGRPPGTAPVQGPAAGSQGGGWHGGRGQASDQQAGGYQGSGGAAGGGYGYPAPAGGTGQAGDQQAGAWQRSDGAASGGYGYPPAAGGTGQAGHVPSPPPSATPPAYPPAQHTGPGAQPTAQPPTAPTPGAQPGYRTDGTAPTEPTPTAAPTPGESTTDTVRSLLVPVADPSNRQAPPAAAPVLPGRPLADRPQVRAPGQAQADGHGTPCPWCATANRPDRHFCVRCAMPMAGERREETPVPLPWWRRLLNSRRGETPWAGDRPRLRRTFDHVVRWVGGALVLALLAGLVLVAPDAVQAARDHFAKRAPVAPDEFRASRSYSGQHPDLAFDKVNNTWWGPGVANSGEGQWIEAGFDHPTRLLDLVITPGQSIRPDELAKSALPHRLRATITMKDGKIKTREITLDQGAGGQRRSFQVGEVTKVRFTIESAYATSAKKQVALAEIEFFGPSNAN